MTFAYSGGEQEDYQKEHGFKANDLPDERAHAPNCELAMLVFSLHVLVGHEELNEVKASSRFVWLQVFVVAVLALEKKQPHGDHDEHDSKHVKVVLKVRNV